MTKVADTFGRGLHDLRVSVTDRCNFRCLYCMPRDVFGADHAFLPRSELLSFEEITRVVASFARAGVTKVRLTGGEPLLRHGLDRLVAMLVAVPGISDIALTTNGSLLEQQAGALKAAGLNRITVSLDSLDPAVFARLADTRVPVETVLAGIRAAAEAGLDPVKINTVVERGVNEDSILELARFGREHGHPVRFIEYMDVGTSNGWRLDDVVPAAEILRRINERWPLEPVEPTYLGEVATRYRYTDGAGEIGLITSITNPFCATCTRARLSAIGEVYTCLFATHGHDLRGLVRGGGSEAELDDAVQRLWVVRTDRYSAERTAHTVPAPSGDAEDEGKVEMSYIGG